MFEFATTDKTLFNIKSNIDRALNIMGLFKSKDNFLVPQIVVVDGCWAMIRSTCESFNSFSIIEYLITSYDIIIEYNNDKIKKIKTIIYICSAHYLKSAIKKTSKFKETKKNVYQAFVYSFTLLQNSTHLEQFNGYLENIHNIFYCKSMDSSVLFSIRVLQTELLNRNLQKLNVNIDVNIRRPIFENKSQIEIDEQSIIEHSPFKKFFDEQINLYDGNIKRRTEENTKNNEVNTFYCPEAFEIIKKKLYLLPLWSGIMLKMSQQENPSLFETSFTRLTNNPVEHILDI